jgi:hypothetical protein
MTDRIIPSPYPKGRARRADASAGDRGEEHEETDLSDDDVNEDDG